jgi:hypothetical protein
MKPNLGRDAIEPVHEANPQCRIARYFRAQL